MTMFSEDRDVIERRALDWARRIALRHPRPVSSVDLGSWRWRILRVKSRLELSIRDRIADLFGRALYAPVRDVTVKRSKRLSIKQRRANVGKTEQRALFPGYLFATQHDVCEVDFSRVPGVYGVLCIGGAVAKVPEYVIAKLRAQERGGVILVADDPDLLRLERGAVVKVLDGPFVGFPGVVEAALDPALDESRRVCVHITLFGQPTPVWLDASQVEVVANAATPTAAHAKKS